MITIIIPTYNRAKTIKRAVKSVLEQTYSDIEVIIVDDASTDNTEEVVNSINDKRIKYFKLNKNQGACNARNVGIKKAKGDYIAFQDSDDEWVNNKLEVQLKNLNIMKSDFDFCAVNVYEDNVLTREIPTKKMYSTINKYGINKALAIDNFISTQTLLCKRSCFKNVLFDTNLPRLQDYDLVLNLVQKYKISHTKEKLVNIYVQGDSISKSSIKFLKATEIFLKKKYYKDTNINNTLYSHLLKECGDLLRDEDKKESHSYYKKSLSYKFSIKVFIKYIIGGLL